MRLTKSLAIVASALVLSTGAAFAGGDVMSSQELQEFLSSLSPQERQEFMAPPERQTFLSYGRGGPELLSDAQLRDALELEQIAQPAEMVLIPLEEPSAAAGN